MENQCNKNKTIVLAFSALLFSASVLAQQSEQSSSQVALQEQANPQESSDQATDSEAGASGPLHPAQLAAESDVVVLAQLDRLDYERRRGFPVSGSGWARVLLRYKVQDPIDLVRIVEEGFGPDRCYFPDVPLWQELPRFLLFLNRGEGRDYTGHRGGCMLEVLVTDNNSYAVRWPQDDLVLNDDELALIEELAFVGPGSTRDVSEMTSISREALLRDYSMEDIGEFTFRYTRGIPLSVFRKQIIGSEALRPQD